MSYVVRITRNAHDIVVREILPELISQIIQLLTSDEVDQQEVRI